MVATSSIRAKTLCRAINVLEAESFHKLIFNCHIQVERKAFPHHHLLYWAQLQGILPCCSIFSPFPWKEKGRKKTKKKTGRKERKLAYVSFTIAEVSCTVECWPTIRAWQMGTERVLWEYWHLFRPSEWRESEVCAWLAARRWSFSGRPRNNTRTPRKKRSRPENFLGRVVNGSTRARGCGSWFIQRDDFTICMCSAAHSLTHARQHSQHANN